MLRKKKMKKRATNFQAFVCNQKIRNLAVITERILGWNFMYEFLIVTNGNKVCKCQHATSRGYSVEIEQKSPEIRVVPVVFFIRTPRERREGDLFTLSTSRDV